MLGDVLEAALDHAESVRLVTDDRAAIALAAGLRVEVVEDPGGGQGPAVVAGLAGGGGGGLGVNAGGARGGRWAVPRRQCRCALCDSRSAEPPRWSGARSGSRLRRHDECSLAPR